MVALSDDDVFVRVTEESQVGEARRTFSLLAKRTGLDEAAVGRVAIAVTELGSNLLRHAGGGGLFGRRLIAGGQDSIEILSMDHGPGIPNLNRALEDGYTTAGSAGTGLGAIERMSDHFSAYSPRQGGTVCLVRLDERRRPEGTAREPRHDLGVVRRPHPLERVAGDGWAVREEGDALLLMVTDGLGHGEKARVASDRAVETFFQARETGLTVLMEALHEGLRSTRGAAVSVLRVEPRAGSIRYVGVGNVGGGVVEGAERISFLSRNGTVGHQMRKVTEHEYPFRPGSLLVLHSDGMKSRWDPRDLQAVLDRPAPLIAGVFTLLHARERDDATVLVLRNRR